MKRKTLVLCAAALLAAGLAAGGTAAGWFRSHGTGTFRVEDYQRYITDFPSDRTVGPVGDAAEARERAEEVWDEVYGDDVVRENTSCRVYFDSTAGLWMVTGRLPGYSKGGVPNIIMRKEDGKVLAVWHGK